MIFFAYGLEFLSPFFIRNYFMYNLKKYWLMYYLNFSEKQILEQVGRNSHLGQGIRRLRLKRVRCYQDYVEHGRLIYQKGKEYKLWIVEYSDILLGITRWFTAMPQILEKEPMEKTYFMVPIDVFPYANESVVYVSSISFDTPEEKTFQLFVDVNDGMQSLIEPWSLNKAKVLDFAVKQKGGTLLDYNIRGRFISNRKERHIVWLIRRRLGKKQYVDLFFDVLKQDFISWNLLADDASMAPISSGQAMVHIGSNSVKADKYGFIYRLGK